MNSSIIALNFPVAMKLKRRTNPNWIDEKLQLDITPIDESNVKEIINKNNPEFDINDPELIKRAMTGVLIEIDELLDFEVIDPKSIIQIKVKENK